MKPSNIADHRRFITIRNAHEKNLQQISLKIPKDQFIVLTGPSGSGKTTLAFDILYAEGKRRYVESLSVFARQFLRNSEKPAVDQISGLMPAIAIEQKTVNKNPRSTVGTITEIYDYLRLLYARVGEPHCVNGHGLIQATTINQMLIQIAAALKSNTPLKVYAPAVIRQKGQFQTLFAKWRKAGFYQVLVNDILYQLTDVIELNKNQKHTILLLVDEFTYLVGPISSQTRLTTALETAISYGRGFVHLTRLKQPPLVYSQHFACTKCDYSGPDMEPRVFSFNSLLGACQTCKGLGTTLSVDKTLLIPNPKLSLNEGGILFYRSLVGSEALDWKKLVALCDYYKIDRDLPLEQLSAAQLERLFYGSDVPIKYWLVSQRTGSRLRCFQVIDGVINIIKRRFLTTSEHSIHSKMVKKYLVESSCSACQGQRLNPAVLAVKLAGYNIAQLTTQSIVAQLQFFRELKLTSSQQLIAALILQEITDRLKFLIDVGLSYLTLARTASTLSGGEAQRIRLATQIGSQLTGVLYVLDEPTIGLHQHDNLKLLKTLRQVSNLGNTVLVVEHDLETMLFADYLIELGPQAGSYGGELIAHGTPEQIKANPRSITGQFLTGKRAIAVPLHRRTGDGKFIEIQKASSNNLQQITVKIPTKQLVCITGLSGSGKSTLVDDVLYHGLRKQFDRYYTKAIGKFQAIVNHSDVRQVNFVSQDPIGKTPRSNPATYTAVFTDIRAVFASTPTAKARGYPIGRFSFNVPAGRCSHCQGDGVIAHSMLFLPDVTVICQECKGQRFNAATLEIKYKQKTIADVLAMEVQQAVIFFANHPKIKRKLQTLMDVGLGYLRLGQRSTELSGGEAQRVKLSAHLNKKSVHAETLYIFDEPTTGLHPVDVAVLLKVLNYLVDQGSSVILIEHNLDVIKAADYLIDLGPGGGTAGGKIVATGTPEAVARIKRSYTGQFLRQCLKMAK